MGGQSGGAQTVTNRTEIDPVTQAWRQQLMGQGGALYNQGAPAYYPGQTVVPFSNQTQAGLDYLQGHAAQGAPNYDAAQRSAGRTLSGWNPAMPYAVDVASGQSPFVQGIYGAARREVAPQVSGMISGAMNQNPWGDLVAGAGARPTHMGVDALRNFANAENPYLDRMYQRGAERVANDVNSQFTRAGRFGANAANVGALTQGLGDLYSSIYAPAYENAQGRALAAAGQLSGIDQANRDAAMRGYSSAGGLYESGAGRGLQAAGLFGSLASDDASRALSGAGAAAGAGMQGAGMMGDLWSQGNQDAMRQQAMLPGLFSYGQMPGQAMMDIGGIYEDQAGRYVEDDIARYNYQANAPWDYLQRYASIVNGLPDFSGSTQTSTGARPNRLMQGLGTAATIASLFARSDRRLKTDIKLLGADEKGLNWYRYRYLWDAPGTERVGVMAQEAPARAVHEGSDGFLWVNYGAL